MSTQSSKVNQEIARDVNAYGASWLASLKDVPSDWALLCVNSKKQPYDPRTGKLCTNWNKTDGKTVEEIQELAPLAVGVLLGEKSGGLLAVDFDGPGSEEKFQEVFGYPSSELPKTISWTSGKKERRQVALVIDQELWGNMKTKRYQKDGKTVLEIRWTGTQSVIAGAHPDTDGYTWMEGCSPLECPDPAPAPDWLLMPLLIEGENEIQNDHSSVESTRAMEMLAYLDPKEFTGYYKWLNLGMALHNTDTSLLGAWVDFCRPMKNFDEIECRKKWDSFSHGAHNITIGSLYYWAKEAGYVETPYIDKKSGVSFLPKGCRGGNAGKVSWLIEGFIAKKALVLLAAEAGSGKSSLLMRAAAAVESGTPFLEQVHTNKGRVLFVQGDEPQHDTEAKLRLMELEGSCVYCFTYQTLDLKWLEKQAKEYDLIIIDSATSLIAEDGVEHEDAAFTRKLYGIGQIIVNNNCSCIITTHLKKSSDGVPRSDLTVEDIAGRATIRNAIQDYWGLFKNPSQNWECHYSLKCFGKRNCNAGDQWELQGDVESFWWGLKDVSDGLAPKVRRELKAKINKWFAQHNEPMSANDLASVLNCTYEHVRRVCVGMFQQGELIRTKVKGGGLGRPNYMYSIE